MKHARYVYRYVLRNHECLPQHMNKTTASPYGSGNFSDTFAMRGSINISRFCDSHSWSMLTIPHMSRNRVRHSLRRQPYRREAVIHLQININLTTWLITLTEGTQRYVPSVTRCLVAGSEVTSRAASVSNNMPTLQTSLIADRLERFLTMVYVVQDSQNFS
jgi:hypothetical protein